MITRGWQKPPFGFWRLAFLAAQDWWDHATDDLRGLSAIDAHRTRFLARQALDMIAPSKFPALNPEIIEATAASGGANLVGGAVRLFPDALKLLARTCDPPPAGYRIGTDLACTPGFVVFRNDLFELIQYAPTTGINHARPILIVPAWIMKYYVLDLSPHNSMVRYLVAQGFTDCDLTFVLTSGGHNTGIVNEPGNQHSRYRISQRPAGALYTRPDHWQEQAEPRPGSWWPAWRDWLGRHAGGEAPPPGLGAPDRGFPPLAAAPGTYVYQT